MDVKELRIDWFFTWFGLCGGAGRAMFDLLVSRLGLPVRRLMSETITHVMTTEALISALGRIINYLTFKYEKIIINGNCRANWLAADSWWLIFSPTSWSWKIDYCDRWFIALKRNHFFVSLAIAERLVLLAFIIVINYSRELIFCVVVLMR